MLMRWLLDWVQHRVARFRPENPVVRMSTKVLRAIYGARPHEASVVAALEESVRSSGHLTSEPIIADPIDWLAVDETPPWEPPDVPSYPASAVLIATEGSDSASVSASYQTASVSAILTAAEDSDSAQEAQALPSENRQERRARMSKLKAHYKRQRKKFDQWVTPEGTPPLQRQKTSLPPPPKHIAPKVQLIEETEDDLIVDVHHADHKTKVLYEVDEFYGAFNFRDTIVSQLDRYWVYLTRMQKHDHEAWDLYRQIGSLLLPYLAVPDIWKEVVGHETEENDVEIHKLSPWFLKTRPAFGCIAYGVAPEAEKIEDEKSTRQVAMYIPRFMYFWKYDRKHVPAGLQPIARSLQGDVYKMTVWMDREHNTRGYKWGRPSDFGVFITGDGRVRVLKMLETKLHMARRAIDGGTRAIPERKWCLPDSYEEWAKIHHTKADLFLANLFVDAAQSWETASHTMCRVTVTKGDMHATFGIDIRTLPYFFKDRDYVLTENGYRKPIAHLVKPYMKQDGMATRFQLRGCRDFTWAGYHVLITIPGMHHLVWEDTDFGLVDWDKTEKHDGVSMKDLGKQIRADMDSGTADASAARRVFNEQAQRRRTHRRRPHNKDEGGEAHTPR